MSSASIHSQLSDTHTQAELAAWACFASPKDASEFWMSWLAILCPQIERVSGALLVLGPDHDGAYSAAAVWPDVSRNMQYLGSTAEKALKEKRGIVDQVFKERRGVIEKVAIERRGKGREGGVPKSAFVGYPIEVSGALHGAVILDIENPSEQELQRALRLMHWGSAWLIDQFRQQELDIYAARLERLSIASDLVATAVQEYQFGASALAVVNELAARLECDRVSLGCEKSGCIEVKAISDTAKFDRKANLVRHISDAMDEVLDLDAVIVYPVADEEALGLLAHAELATELRDVAVCSVPLIDGGEVVGVITLERTHGVCFSAEEVSLCETTGLLLGPILWLKLQNERSAFQRLREGFSRGAQALFGPRHSGVKLIALVVVLIIVFFSLYQTDYRVSSKAVVEGALQRAVAAPFDGYIAEGQVRAGDTVKKGQVLSRLDDRDLKLDQVRWASERAQSERRFRQALAQQDRTAMTIAQAQINQAQAQLSLAEEKLARATLTAPFDGIVVSGDLRQLLGSPVEQGRVLFEIAPLDTYRVILNVDERDISQIEVGQAGSLALSGIPYNVMHFAVKQVTPVSTSEDGTNYFRVEAQIEGPADRLRPGMEGVGKVSVGERKLIWIFTHSLVDWFRLWSWKWMP